MKTLLTAAALSFAMASAAFAADPIIGTWQTIKDDNGNVVELEVLYLCETPEGHQFAIDDSRPYDEKSR